MGIQGLNPSSRLPRVGKIHLGIKGDGKYPTRVDFFHVKEDISTPKEMAEAFHKIVGVEPKEIEVRIISSDVNAVCPAWFKLYNKSGLQCKGDGINCKVHNLSTDQWETKMDCCAYKECKQYKDKKCKRIANFSFIIPSIQLSAVWQIDTSSINSIKAIYNGINQAKTFASLSGRQVFEIPMLLRVEMLKIKHIEQGKTMYTEQPIMNLTVKDSGISGMSLAVDAPITEADKEVPEDLISVDEQPEVKKSSIPDSVAQLMGKCKKLKELQALTDKLEKEYKDNKEAFEELDLLYQSCKAKIEGGKDDLL